MSSIIDKGKGEGLARDMAVITADGIVGKVREVFPHSAQVLAINDQTSGAGVILETTRIRGILRGNAEGQPQIVGILADQRIKPGENVLTAGGDQIFPRGLPVGVVEKVVNDPDRDGFINVIVKPAAHLDRLDEVLVITSTEPRFSPQQQKDIATSEALKGADAAALAEQRKASAIMAERLPGLTDPNAPPKPADAKGANGAPPAPDHAGGSQGSAAAASRPIHSRACGSIRIEPSPAAAAGAEAFAGQRPRPSRPRKPRTAGPTDQSAEAETQASRQASPTAAAPKEPINVRADGQFPPRS